MNTNIKTAAKLAAFAGAFALTGCAFMADTVHPTYTPPANVTKVPGADKVVVDVIVKNEKKHKDGQISWMKNGYDMATAKLYMHVSRDFKSAIEKALFARGFSVSKNGNGKIEVVIHHFYSHETNDWSGITQDGSGSFTVFVKNSSGRNLYEKHIAFKNYVLKLSAFALTTDRSKIAKNMLSLSIKKIFNEPGFIKALGDIHKGTSLGVYVQNVHG